MLAIICAGATFCAADAAGEKESTLHRLKLANPKLLFCSANSYDKFKESFSKFSGLEHFVVYGNQAREGAILFKDFLSEHAEIEDFLPVPVSPDDPVIVLYSTGSTGPSKGSPCTNRGILMTVEGPVNNSIYKNKVNLGTRRWCYPSGILHTLNCMVQGATLVYSPTNNPRQHLNAINAYKVQVMQLGPTTLRELVDSSATNTKSYSMELVLWYSMPCKAESVNLAKTIFPNLRKVCRNYGMTDIGRLASNYMGDQGFKIGSVGLVGPGMQVKVVDLKTGKPLGPNQRGELCGKSISYMPWYLGLTSTDHLDSESFFKTGDVGYYDEDGYIFLVDRIKELIHYNSTFVYPAELEAVLEQHPAVREAGVVGTPHPQYGEAPTAFVVLQSGATISAEVLIKYVDEHKVCAMCLGGSIRFLNKLPRLNGDKIDKIALKLLI